MKANLYRFLVAVLALCVLSGLAAPVLAAQAAETETVEISTVEDLLTFAKSCSLDAWSRGKTFRLTADLDLAGTGFSPIPTFGGTFLGEGHTLSGLSVTAAGSHMGLFRFVQPGAVIRDLHVSGRVAPGGSAANVGGIAGNNAGSLQNCSFQGTVKGKDTVGGIAGQNEAAGEVSGCSAAGIVSGENGTGGIAGRNLGMLLSCQSAADVNTSDPDSSGGADVGSTLDQLAAPNAGEEVGDILNSHTDTGGVAGYSSGMIQSCSNGGTVGYRHVGYNVGGVVGRQAGYMSGCSNSAAVYGRKDVGGIVGQAEPDIILNTDGDTLAQLRQELNTLNALVDRALDNTDANRAGISQMLTAIGGDAGDARDHTRTLLEQAAGFTDGNLDALNTLAAAVTAALDGLAPALDGFSGAAGDLETLGQALGGALDTLWDSGNLSDGVLAGAKDALADLRAAGDHFSSAVQEIRAAADALQRAVIIHDQAAIRGANRQLAVSIRSLGAALSQAHAALDALHTALDGQHVPDLGQIAGSLGDLGNALKDSGTALEGIGDALDTISSNVEIDWVQIRSALDAAGSSLDLLDAASQRMGDALERLENAVSAAGPLADSLGQAAGRFSDAADAGSGAAGKLKSAFQTLRDVAEQLYRDGGVQFTPLSQQARAAGDGLYASLTDLSGDFTDLQNAVDRAGDGLSADLRAISRQITKIFNLMLDVLDSAQTVEAPEDLFGDVSEEDIGATRLGKVSSCVNNGAVEGDRNVGGVAGAVAVEYSLDPEDDAPRFTFGSTYELKAILQECVNRGGITGKRDCVGGIAGRMDLGTANGCESYGSVSSSGSYVGGVAGYAAAAVRDCWAKCTLSGTEYVGGIAGWASRMTGCRAIVSIAAGTEYLGSIAGGAELTGGLRDNCFVDLGTAGIDGVSYAGIAEPVLYEALVAGEGAPSAFLSFTLTLTADGETVAVLPFRYGDDLSGLELPPVPAKEGYYGTWPDFDRSGVSSNLTLEAAYTPWATLVASRETEGNLALALAEGQFTGEAALTVAEREIAPPLSTEGASVWEVSLTGTGLDGTASVPLRLLNRSGKRSAVWQLTDGAWREVETTVNGSYLCLTMTGTSGVFCVQPLPGAPWPPILLAAGAVLLLAAPLRGKVKRKKGALQK